MAQSCFGVGHVGHVGLVEHVDNVEHVDYVDGTLEYCTLSRRGRFWRFF